MKKKYNCPQVQIIYLEEPILLLADTKDKELIGVTYDDPTNPTSPPKGPSIGVGGDEDNGGAGAKPWTPLFE